MWLARARKRRLRGNIFFMIGGLEVAEMLLSEWNDGVGQALIQQPHIQFSEYGFKYADLDTRI
jgi:hypothetical protein